MVGYTLDIDHLPNNKISLWRRNQAAELTEDKDIIVVLTKTIPLGNCGSGIKLYSDYTAEGK